MSSDERQIGDRVPIIDDDVVIPATLLAIVEDCFVVEIRCGYCLNYRNGDVLRVTKEPKNHFSEVLEYLYGCLDENEKI